MSLENRPYFILNFSERDLNSDGRNFYSFKSFRLNVEERQLLQNNAPVSLTPKAFDVLVALVERNGHLIEKDELLRAVWADSFVEEANITRIIHTLRKTLGEDENGNKFIETVPTKGYRFVAEVNKETDANSRSRSNDHAAFVEAHVDTLFPADTEVENTAPPADPTRLKRFLLAGFAVLIATSLISFFLLGWNQKSSPVSNRPITFYLLIRAMKATATS